MSDSEQQLDHDEEAVQQISPGKKGFRSPHVEPDFDEQEGQN
jgi:hypothetical protein